MKLEFGEGASVVQLKDVNWNKIQVMENTLRCRGRVSSL